MRAVSPRWETTDVEAEPVGASEVGRGSGFRASFVALGESQKPQLGVSFYTLYLNRRWGRFLAAGANALGMTPNMVTIVSALCSAVAIFIIAVPGATVLTGFLSGGLLMLAFAFDSADGQVSRLQRASSRTGEFLDHVLDCSVKIGLHSAVLIAWYNAGREGAVLLIPLLFLFSSVVFYFGGILLLKMREQARAGREGTAEVTGVNPVRALLLLPVDFGIVSASFLLWGWSSLSLVAYTSLAIAQTLFLLVFVVRWRQELA